MGDSVVADLVAVVGNGGCHRGRHIIREIRVVLYDFGNKVERRRKSRCLEDRQRIGVLRCPSVIERKRHHTLRELSG